MSGIVQVNPQTKQFTAKNADSSFAKPKSTQGIIKTAPSERPAGPTVVSQNPVTGSNGFNVLK